MRTQKERLHFRRLNFRIPWNSLFLNLVDGVNYPFLRLENSTLGPSHSLGVFLVLHGNSATRQQTVSASSLQIPFPTSPVPSTRCHPGAARCNVVASSGGKHQEWPSPALKDETEENRPDSLSRSNHGSGSGDGRPESVATISG